MSLEQGFTIIDDALNLAVEKLESQGMPEQEAYIALLVRLWSTVPEEVAEIANMLRDDPDLLSAMNTGAVSEPSAVQAG
ncbi:MAG: hypothetical protein EBT93_14565 [Alphaproteobacteria bacterium]|nr:hypothetical protein [Alphaproteobacteria bacterium]